MDFFLVFFSKCLLLLPVHTNRIQLGKWVVTLPVGCRQQMGGETGHESGLMTQKRNLAGGKMPAWICAWTMFTVGTIYKGFRTVSHCYRVLYFPSHSLQMRFWNPLVLGRGWQCSQTSPELLPLGILRAGKHLRWKMSPWAKPAEGLGTAPGSVWAALPWCKGADCTPREPREPFEFSSVSFILAFFILCRGANNII